MKNDLIEKQEEKNVRYHVGQAFFYQVDPGLDVFPMFCQGGW